jgi:glyoxylase-like metal-dependent hydrolase (beta-lactamase superfamily II)
MERKSELNVERTSLKIGPYDIYPVPTGIFGLDGGAMFGTVPRTLWEKSNPPDDKNRIAMEARALLLRSADRNILIDTGNGSDFVAKHGEKLGAKFAEIYAIDESGPSLKKSLQNIGLTFDDITDVILTHLHFDHAGGATRESAGKIIPTFPNATYYVQSTNLDTAQNPHIRERASYLPANFQPLIEAGKLNLLKGDVENLFPGVSVMVSNGHTQGEQIVKVSDGKTHLVYCADLIPTSSHVRLAWIMGYDLEPKTLIAEKSKILNAAADENWYLFFEHDPYCDAAQIQRQGSDFKCAFLFSLHPPQHIVP